MPLCNLRVGDAVSALQVLAEGLAGTDSHDCPDPLKRNCLGVEPRQFRVAPFLLYNLADCPSCDRTRTLLI